MKRHDRPGATVYAAAAAVTAQVATPTAAVQRGGTHSFRPGWPRGTSGTETWQRGSGREIEEENALSKAANDGVEHVKAAETTAASFFRASERKARPESPSASPESRSVAAAKASVEARGDVLKSKEENLSRLSEDTGLVVEASALVDDCGSYGLREAPGLAYPSPASRGVETTTGLDVRWAGRSGTHHHHHHNQQEQHTGVDETLLISPDGAECSGGDSDNASSNLVAQAVRTPSTARREHGRSSGLLSSLRGTVASRNKPRTRSKGRTRSESPRARG